MRKYDKALIGIDTHTKALQHAAEVAILHNKEPAIWNISSSIRYAVQELAHLRRFVGWQSVGLFPQPKALLDTLEHLATMNIGDTHQIERAVTLVRKCIQESMTTEEIQAIAFGKHLLPHTAHHTDNSIRPPRHEDARRVAEEMVA